MKKMTKKYEDGGGTKSSTKTSKLSNRITRLGKLEQAMAKDTGRGDMDQMSRYNTVAAKLERAKNKMAKTPVKKMGGMTKFKKK